MVDACTEPRTEVCGGCKNNGTHTHTLGIRTPSSVAAVNRAQSLEPGPVWSRRVHSADRSRVMHGVRGSLAWTAGEEDAFRGRRWLMKQQVW